MEYIVYVKITENNYILNINSSEFLADTTGWIEIDRGYSDRHHHAQGNYFDKPILTDNGAYNYKLIDGKPIECTEEEIKTQEEVINKPTVTIEDRVSILENKMDVKITEYEESLLELGVEL